MGDMTAQMDQMNFNALLVNVTFKSDFFMKKVFLYNLFFIPYVLI